MLNEQNGATKPTRQNGATRCIQIDRNGLQEFRENLVDDRVPERRDSHASSSHEQSLEPTLTRSVELGKHSGYSHFPEDRNCEICKRTKIKGPHAEDAMAKPYLEL